MADSLRSLVKTTALLAPLVLTLSAGPAFASDPTPPAAMSDHEHHERPAGDPLAGIDIDPPAQDKHKTGKKRRPDQSESSRKPGRSR